MSLACPHPHSGRSGGHPVHRTGGFCPFQPARLPPARTARSGASHALIQAGTCSRLSHNPAKLQARPRTPSRRRGVCTAMGDALPQRPAAAGPTLLAFDFDWSLLEENSDTFVIRELGVDALFDASKSMPWTQRMDHCLQEAAQHLGRTPQDVVAALHRAPMHPELVELLRAVAAAATTTEGDGEDGGGGSESASSGRTDVVILSDANTVYIDTILKHHGLQGTVREVLSNPAEWRGGALRVGPYHTCPHGCRHCPANLCKGQVLHELLGRQAAAGQPYSRVLYVGDGRGDFCPSILLLHGSTGSSWQANPMPVAGGGSEAAEPDATAAASRGARSEAEPSTGAPLAAAPPPCGGSRNVVFAREEYPDGLPCSLWVMLRTELAPASQEAAAGPAAQAAAGPAAQTAAGPAAGQATAAEGSGPRGVVGWTRPEQLAALLRQELQLGGGTA